LLRRSISVLLGKSVKQFFSFPMSLRTTSNMLPTGYSFSGPALVSVRPPSSGYSKFSDQRHNNKSSFRLIFTVT
jgi:hypothetical protein